jgi:RNA polymerase sigma-70 factor (ECF subfamily)
MGNNEPTDADLVASVLAGDREAFARLYDRYARLVRATASGVTKDWAVVQDLTQECFLRAYRNLARLHPPDHFGRWVVGIARHVARERRRTVRRDRHRFVAGDALEAPSAPNAVDRIQSTEQIERVMHRLAELPERERLAIDAFFLQDCDSRKAAQLLGLSRSGAYALLTRALGRLASLVCRCETKKEAE